MQALTIGNAPAWQARCREGNPVAGEVALAVLPHHRTYGSVSGGSCDAIEAAVLHQERWQPEIGEEGGPEGIVHVAGPGIPPGAAAVAGRCPRPFLHKPPLQQTRMTRGRSW